MHAKKRRKTAKQNRQLEGQVDKGWPGVKWASSNVDRISDRCDPVLKRVCRYPADECTNEDHKRHAVLMKADGFRKALNGERAIGVDLLVARFVSLVSGGNQFLRRVEFGHQSVDRRIPDGRFIA